MRPIFWKSQRDARLDKIAEDAPRNWGGPGRIAAYEDAYGAMGKRSQEP